VRAVEQDLSIARPWVLVGHSMGGRVAMRVAAIAALEVFLLGSASVSSRLLVMQSNCKRQGVAASSLVVRKF